DVTRRSGDDIALEVDLEDHLRLLQRLVEVVAVEAHVAGGFTVPVQDGRHLAIAAQAACGTLAEVGARLCGESYLCHVISQSWNVRQPEGPVDNGAREGPPSPGVPTSVPRCPGAHGDGRRGAHISV